MVEVGVLQRVQLLILDQLYILFVDMSVCV
jgi:hypothetical protein